MLKRIILLRHKLLKPSNDAPLCLTRGLDPRVHLLREKMDCRVKPGNDADSCGAVGIIRCTAILLAALGLLGIDAAGASTLPPPIEAIIAGYASQCHRLGGALAAGADRPQIMTGDFDGDGVSDYVLNPQNLRCSAAATAFCGNGGCQIAIALSGNNYREPITVLGGQPTLVQKPSGAIVEISVHGSNCNGFDREKACWASYSWIDGKAATTYQLRPRPR